MTSMRDGSSTSEAPYSWRSFFHLFLDPRDGLRRKGGIADLLFMSLCFRPWAVMLLRCKLPSLEEVGNYKKIKGHRVKRPAFFNYKYYQSIKKLSLHEKRLFSGSQKTKNQCELPV